MKKWSLIIFLSLAGFQLQAQLLVANGVSITINSGVSMTVNGDMEMQGTTTVNNSGTIALTGNWTNNAGAGVFGTSKGTVLMNGINQHIQGSFPTTFYHLTLQNGTKTLHTNISTGGGAIPYNGVLNLTNAVLSLKSNMVSVFNSSSTAIQRTTGYILSEEATNLAKVWWVNVNAGVHTIPFGNSAGNDISFSFTAAPPSGFQESSLRISTYATLPDNTPYPVSPVVINHVNNTAGSDNSANTVDRFWHIEHTGSCSFTFKYAASEQAVNGNTQLRAQAWNTLNAGWMPPPAGQTNPTAQQVNVPLVTATTPGTLQGTTWALAMNATPLPVELLAFTAIAAGEHQVRCKWTTLTETNNDYFTVQRSVDGITFKDISVVDGNGTSNALNAYSFDDINAFTGISYYRLKQTDYDGNFSLSSVAAVHLRGNAGHIRLFPVPANEVLYILNAPGEIISFTIYDHTGRIAGEGTCQAPLYNVNTAELSDGIYHIEIRNDVKQETRSFIIHHP